LNYVYGLLQRSFAEVAIDTFECFYRRVSRYDECRSILSRAKILRDDSGRVQRVVGIDIDVTVIDQKRGAYDFVLKNTASVIGEEFFWRLVQTLSAALKISAVSIIECIDGKLSKARTLASSNNEFYAHRGEFNVAGTPCERVLENDTRCVTINNLKGKYPDFAPSLGSYLGVPIRNASGRILGHFLLLDQGDTFPSIGEIFFNESRAIVDRARGELERLISIRDWESVRQRFEADDFQFRRGRQGRMGLR
jgi:hypothetical protein